MKFLFFHLMPYLDANDSPTGWPAPNKQFNPGLGHELYDTYLKEIVLAEQCGFDFLAVNEHHMSPYSLMANPNLIAGALSYRTQHAKLAVLGNLVPLLNPVRVAEEYAMLDVMSGGRLIAGLMRGIPHEYMAYSIPPDESWERFKEACDLIVKCWTEPEPFAWEGKYYQYRAVSIWPRPMQQPHPNILLSGGSIESAKYAAKKRAMIGIIRVKSIDDAKRNIQAYVDTARAEGWEPTPEHVLVGFHACIAETDKKARELLEAGENYFYHVLSKAQHEAGQLILQKSKYDNSRDSQPQKGRFNEVQAKAGEMSFDDRIRNHTLICGSPETVVEQIKFLRKELGAGIFSLNFKIAKIPHEDVVKGLQLFQEKVLPHVRNH
ncbi:LLM class flavin-dependent oxidoreductase [Paenibacillus cisolokensis]|uniref:LLM class flavin-dependent oxidoreductase n=1 Tax=Paenibacillus cisolokensis TaxID=1658519 RepID=UPI003D27DEAC